MLKCSKLMGIVYPKGVIPLQMPECFAASAPFFKRNDAKVQRDIPPKCIKVYRSVLNCIVTYPNVSKCIKLYRSVSKDKFIGTYPSLSELIGINPISSDWFRLILISSD